MNSSEFDTLKPYPTAEYFYTKKSEDVHFTFFVLIAGLWHMHANRGRGGVRPLKEHPKADVIIVCGKLPEQVRSFLVGGDPHRDHLTAPHRDHAVWVLADLLLEVLDLRPCPHRRSRYDGWRVWRN